ncbi:MAG: sirohydrochlorin cobaltochelatase [Prevotella sp.]|nr:sirohydrochlorin cobaltochelatase [Prevotella sp.]
MRRLFLFLTIILCAASVRAQDVIEPPTAMLLVHFGTTYDDTRAKTIDAINAKAQKEFPGLAFAEAYTSRIVMSRLEKRGIRKETPTDALLRLRAQGHRRILIQPTYVIDGIEMDRLRKETDNLRPFFDSLWISTPLLYSVEDAEQVCGILAARHPADIKKHEHVLFVGHGTESPATALYSQLDYMLRAQGHPNYHVATIEGYPTFDTAVGEMKQMKVRKVVLVPLLFEAGDHASNDISVEWKQQLEKLGFSVELHIEGLGEVPEIQDLYIKKMKNGSK